MTSIIVEEMTGWQPPSNDDKWKRFPRKRRIIYVIITLVIVFGGAAAIGYTYAYFASTPQRHAVEEAERELQEAREEVRRQLYGE